MELPGSQVIPVIPRTQVADMLPKEVMEAEATAKVGSHSKEPDGIGGWFCV